MTSHGKRLVEFGKEQHNRRITCLCMFVTITGTVNSAVTRDECCNASRMCSVSERVGIFIYHGIIRDEYTIFHRMS